MWQHSHFELRHFFFGLKIQASADTLHRVAEFIKFIGDICRQDTQLRDFLFWRRLKNIGKVWGGNYSNANPKRIRGALMQYLHLQRVSSTAQAKTNEIKVEANLMAAWFTKTINTTLHLAFLAKCLNYDWHKKRRHGIGKVLSIQASFINRSDR